MLAWGGTAILERLPSGAVVKTPIPNPYCPPEERDHRRNMRLEAEIYALIGDHPRIPRIINWDNEACCLTMEYLKNGNLKDYVYQNNQNIALQHRIQWCLQAAEGLSVCMGIILSTAIYHQGTFFLTRISMSVLRILAARLYLVLILLLHRQRDFDTLAMISTLRHFSKMIFLVLDLLFIL
jgi:serine/threonine protein kinase